MYLTNNEKHIKEQQIKEQINAKERSRSAFLFCVGKKLSNEIVEIN
jgi:hypothetical protein